MLFFPSSVADWLHRAISLARLVLSPVLFSTAIATRCTRFLYVDAEKLYLRI